MCCIAKWLWLWLSQARCWQTATVPGTCAAGPSVLQQKADERLQQWQVVSGTQSENHRGEPFRGRTFLRHLVSHIHMFTIIFTGAGMASVLSSQRGILVPDTPVESFPPLDASRWADKLWFASRLIVIPRFHREVPCITIMPRCCCVSCWGPNPLFWHYFSLLQAGSTVTQAERKRKELKPTASVRFVVVSPLLFDRLTLRIFTLLYSKIHAWFDSCGYYTTSEAF